MRARRDYAVRRAGFNSFSWCCALWTARLTMAAEIDGCRLALCQWIWRGPCMHDWRGTRRLALCAAGIATRRGGEAEAIWIALRHLGQLEHDRVGVRVPVAQVAEREAKELGLGRAARFTARLARVGRFAQSRS